MVKHGALLAPKEVVVQKQYFIFLGCMFKKRQDKNNSFWHFCLCGNMQEIGLLKKVCGKRCHTILNKNHQKAIFNWAAKGLFFLRGGGTYTHSGYYKTLSPTIACDRISCETEHKLIQNIVPF